MIKNAAALVAGLVFMAVAFELILRALPVPMGMDLVDGYASGHPLRYKPNGDFVYSRDWDFLHARSGRFNVLGYHGICNPNPDNAKRRVWFVGDSYAEAIMIDPSESVAAAIGRLRPDLTPCTLAISGAPASEYLALIDHYMHKSRDDVWVIVLNAADITESLGGRDGFHYFKAIDNPELTGRARSEPPWLSILKMSSLFRYINYNLDVKGIIFRLKCSVWLHQCVKKDPTAAEAAEEERSYGTAARSVASAIASRIASTQNETIVLLNAFDPKRLTPTTIDAEQRHVKIIQRELESMHIPALSVADIFQPARDCDGKYCYLFRDGHWSQPGHAAIAARLAEAIPTRKPLR